MVDNSAYFKLDNVDGKRDLKKLNVSLISYPGWHLSVLTAEPIKE